MDGYGGFCAFWEVDREKVNEYNDQVKDERTPPIP